MTTINSIVPQENIQQVNSIAMVLLSMVDHYKLPESVNSIIMDLQCSAENLQGAAIMSEHVYNLRVMKLDLSS